MGIDTGLEASTSELPDLCRQIFYTHPQPNRWPQSLERETGIEPVSLAWKAKVLPLNYSRMVEEAGFEPA